MVDNRDEEQALQGTRAGVHVAARVSFQGRREARFQSAVWNLRELDGLSNFDSWYSGHGRQVFRCGIGELFFPDDGEGISALQDNPWGRCRVGNSIGQGKEK